ncbi:MAG TPA: SoxR reducing system RseC family protein [Candidatus Brocadiia bacterium]|nr:SoxR reducing system RseC family protein [Planctomycetota bacterium]MDO8093817.1 SoxR reducing system RseC family protein [Candidatus Brocadiales bacterium]
MEEKGIIKDIKGNTAVVEIQKKASDECSRCGICASAGDTTKIMRVDCVPGLTIGQKVTLEITGPSAYKGILLLFVAPIVAFITGGIVGQHVTFVFPSSENLRIGIFGLAFIALCMFCVHLYDRRLRARKFIPKIISIDALPAHST